MTTTLNSSGNLFICTVRDKNLDLELHYSALDTAGTLLLAKTLGSTEPGLGRPYELGVTPRRRRAYSLCERSRTFSGPPQASSDLLHASSSNQRWPEMLKPTMIHAGYWASVNTPWSSDGFLSGGCRPGGGTQLFLEGGGQGELQHREMDST